MGFSKDHQDEQCLSVVTVLVVLLTTSVTLWLVLLWL